MDFDLLFVLAALMIVGGFFVPRTRSGLRGFLRLGGLILLLALLTFAIVPALIAPGAS